MFTGFRVEYAALQRIRRFPMVKRLIYPHRCRFVAAFAVLAFAACSSDDPTGPEEQAPALPAPRR